MGSSSPNPTKSPLGETSQQEATTTTTAKPTKKVIKNPNIVEVVVLNVGEENQM